MANNRRILNFLNLSERSLSGGSGGREKEGKRKGTTRISTGAEGHSKNGRSRLVMILNT